MDASVTMGFLVMESMNAKTTTSVQMLRTSVESTPCAPTQKEATTVPVLLAINQLENYIFKLTMEPTALILMSVRTVRYVARSPNATIQMELSTARA